MGRDTIAGRFLDSAERFRGREAVRRKVNGRWEGIVWEDYEATVRAIASGLIRLGLPGGGAVSILSTTRPEWTICDLAALFAGGITVGIYPSNTPDQCRYILNHSESRFLFVENAEQRDKILCVREDLPQLEKIIIMDGEAGGDSLVITLEEMIRMGKEALPESSEAMETRIAGVKPTDVATLIYTSGTTGPPKGAMLTHQNILAAVDGMTEMIAFYSTDVSLSFLPLAHVLQRVFDYLYLFNGILTNYAESMEKLGENLAETAPTAMVGVPRVYEKIHTRVIAAVEAGPPLKRRLFHWAMRVGREVSRHRQARAPIPAMLKVKFKVADALVFKKLKNRVGGRVRFFGTGGAPLAREIAEFFHAADLLILEGYGLTENAGPATVNTPDHYRFGTVGRALPGVEIKIAGDGEILIKGDIVFKGYFKDPDATAEALKDGWLHTGDVGELDPEGFLTITDRKKDLIVTAAGKNVAPQNIENLLKTSKYISQAMVYGDRRQYLIALITLDEEEIKLYALENEVKCDSYAELVEHERVKELIRDVIDEKNRQLAQFETIKRFAILPEDFTQEREELTPTMKVRRREVTRRYQELLDSLYEE